MIRTVLIVVVVALMLVVASENRKVLVMAEVLFGFRTPPFSLGLLILLCFSLGAAAVALWLVPAWVRASLLARRQRRQIDELERQLVAESAPPPSEPPTGEAPRHDRTDESWRT